MSIEVCTNLGQGRIKIWLLFLWAASFSVSKGNALITPSSFQSNLHAQVDELRIKGRTLPVGALSARGGSELAAEAEDTVTDEASSESVENNQMGPNSVSPGLVRQLLPSLPWHKLPNWLTYARCIAIPALIVQFYIGKSGNKNIHSSLIFAIASITDFLDGYLARRWDICSPFGAFLDPVADKLMVSTALILLSGKYGSFVAIPSAIILAREIAVSALREWMASRGKRDSVKVGFQGKVSFYRVLLVSINIIGKISKYAVFTFTIILLIFVHLFIFINGKGQNCSNHAGVDNRFECS